MKIPPMNNFSDWYQYVITYSKVAEYGPSQGSMILRPYGFALWKRVQEVLGRKIEEHGVEDTYFPVLIPYSLLNLEKSHVEGFLPEVATVTKAGNQILDEPLVVRPTSETIIYNSFSRWIKSYRDLPLKINQWVNVVRWEKRSLMFIRGREFLWQEGHTAHVSKEEADEEVLYILNMYEEFLNTYMAIPTFKGRKTEGEKFAGALYTTTLEAMMLGKKALQMCTSHNLGQNFSRAFGIKYLDSSNVEQYVWQTSWGLSTRTLGALIGIHGDEKGMVLPPKMAPYQVVIVPIIKNNEDLSNVAYYIKGVEQMLAGSNIRYKTDWTDATPGWKFNEWELRGVPLRVEVGGEELKNNDLKIVKRFSGEKLMLHKESETGKKIAEMLDDIQAEMYKKAKIFVDSNTHEAKNEKEFAEIIEDGGFAKVFFRETEESVKYIKEKYKATPRVIPIETVDEKGKDFLTGEVGSLTIFAKSY